MPGVETTADHRPIVGEERQAIDFFDFLFVLVEAKRRIAIWVLIAMILGAAIAYFTKPTFTASALILPPQQGQSALTSLMGQLGSLASLAGAGSGLKTPADMYIGVLESRTIADDLIAKFRLQDLYKTKTMEDTRLALKKHSRFIATKDGLIHITVDDGSAVRASAMTNAYVDELHRMNSTLAVTEAAQRRVFFDQELVNEKTALANAENALKQMEEKTGVIQLTGQAELVIRNLSQVRAEIASREVQLQSMRTFATDENPDAVRLQEEIRSLQGQLAKLENDPRASQMEFTRLPAGRVPAVSLEYARKLRDLRFNEALYELLTKQYEAARIDEAKAAPTIQVIDRAVPPDKKSSPHRTLITLGFGFVAFVLASAYSLANRMLVRLETVPEYSTKVARVRSWAHFRWRRRADR